MKTAYPHSAPSTVAALEALRGSLNGAGYHLIASTAQPRLGWNPGEGLDVSHEGRVIAMMNVPSHSEYGSLATWDWVHRATAPEQGRAHRTCGHYGINPKTLVATAHELAPYRDWYVLTTLKWGRQSPEWIETRWRRWVNSTIHFI